MSKNSKQFLIAGSCVQSARLFLFAFACVACAACFASFAFSQTIPLEDKAKYEKVLEQKVDDVLLRILGPNRAKVLVEAEMDFTRIEKLQVQKGSAAGSGEKDFFRWQKLAGSEGNQQLMPGFPAVSAFEEAGDQSYERQTTFPASFIKKLSVTVLLDRSVPSAEAENVRSVVSDLLLIDAKRGDEVTVLRAPFAPAWKTIWYTPEAVGLIFKYGVLTFMGIIAMIVVAIGFLKLAGAMNTMAKAQQSHMISMDFGKGAAPAGLVEGPSALPGLSHEGGEKAAQGMREDSSETEGEEVVFNVKANQVPFLVHILAKEEPANIALVTAHLAPEIRKEFLRALPAETASDVIANMAKVRFVEPDVISTLKDELERRLQGAVGGVTKVLEILENVNLRAKKEMLQRLEEKHPDIVREVRSRVLLVEDLGRLPDKDISLLVSSIKLEDLSSAVWEMPEALKEKIRGQMAEKSWQMVEQSMKYGAPSAAKTEKAQEDLVETAGRLIKEGRITDPLLNLPPLITEESRAA
ncbi:MAG: FliG C-terminal domain-containing protein [bacterium]